MARKSDIRLRRSAVSGSVPGGADLNLGELALNTADGAIFVKNGAGNIVTVSHDGILHYDEPNSRIGIGTDSPDVQLHIATPSGNPTIGGADVTNARLLLGTTSNGMAFDNNEIAVVGDNLFIETMGNHDIRFRTNGTQQKMIIKGDGKVGIGTVEPATNLEVRGSTPKLRITDTRSMTFTVGDIMSSIEFNSLDDSGGSGTSTQPRAAVNMYAASTFGSSTGLAFYTKGDNQSYPSKQMVIDHTGQVGIGVSSPTGNLEINGGHGVTSSGTVIVRQRGNTGNDGIAITSNNATSHRIWKAYDGTLNIGPSTDLSAMVQKLDGKVGIGTASPRAKLDVNGSINVEQATSIALDQDTYTDTAILIPRGTGIRSNTTGDYQRNLLSHNGTSGNGALQIGQQGTSIITDVLVYPGSSGNIRFFPSGSEDVRFDISGNVGIGNTNPVARLDVAGEDTGPSSIFDYGYATNEGIRVFGNESAIDIVGNDNGTHASSLLMRNSNEGFALVNNPGSNRLEFRSFTATADDFKVHNNGTAVNALVDILTLEKAGNVGVGTNTPVSLMHASSADASVLTLQNTTNAGNSALHFRDENNVDQYKVYYDQPNNKAYQTFNGNGLTFYSAQTSSEVAKIGYGAGYNTSYFTGNVGIGTANPAAKLHVGPDVLLNSYTSDRTTLAVSDITDGAELILRGQSPRIWFDATSSGNGQIYLDTAELQVYSGFPGSAGTQRLNINSSGGITFNNAYTFPTSIGSSGQILKVPTSGTELIWANETSSAPTQIIDSDADTSVTVEANADEDIIRFNVAGSEVGQVTNDGLVLNDGYNFEADVIGAIKFKAQAGEALTKGDAVYISGISGNTTIVSKADANDAAKMPAFGLAASTVSLNSAVQIVTFGTLQGIDTSSYTEGDELYVNVLAGELTDSAPTGSSSALQKIAKVTRSDASAGSVKVSGAGRTNATPNLDEGKIFVGNSSNKSVQGDDTLHVDMANSRVGINKAAPLDALHVDGVIRTHSSSESKYIRMFGGNTGNFIDSHGNALYIRPGGDTSKATLIDSSGNVTIAGDLIVNGTNTTLNTSTLTVDDLNITVADGATSSAQAAGAGLTVAGANKSLQWDHGNQYFEFDAEVYSPAWIIGTTATKVGRIKNNSGVFNIAAYSAREISLGNDTNGEHVRIDASGFVGIGTNDPQTRLHIVHGSSTNNIIQAFGGGSIYAGMGVDGDGTILTAGSSGSANSAMKFRTSDSGSEAERMRITPTGNVGINVTSPHATLHQRGAAIVGEAGDTNGKIMSFKWLKSNTGSSGSGVWYKVADISLPNGGYSACSFKASYITGVNNFGDHDYIKKYENFISIVRNSTATANNTPDTATVTGVTGLIRVYKTGTGTYELQAKGDSANMKYRVEVEVYHSAATITPKMDGSTLGTTTGGTEYTVSTITNANLGYIRDSGVINSRFFNASDGSDSAPSITFNSDKNTGLSRYESNGADRLAISTGGSKRAEFGTHGIQSHHNVYTGDGDSFRNYGGVWAATTGVANNGFYFLNTSGSNTTKALEISHDGHGVFNKSLLVNGADDNSGKADFSVGVGGSPQLSLHGNQVQIGGTDMNYNSKFFYDGSTKLAAWDSNIEIYSNGSNTGSANARDIIFKPQINGTGVATERLRIKGETGRVGIGDINPYRKLHIVDESQDDGEIMWIKGGSGYGATIVYDRGGSYQWEAGVGGGSSTNSNIPVSYFGIGERAATGRPARFLIAYTTGNVGIGVTPSTSSNVKLHVKADDGVTGVIKVEGGKNTVTSNGEINSQLDFGSNDNSVNNSGNIGGRIASVTEATNGAYTGLAFSTFKQSRSPDLKEAMRIAHSGKVGIGDAPTNPQSTLHVSSPSDDGSGIRISRVSSSGYMQLYPAYSGIPTIMSNNAGLHLGYASNTAGIRIHTGNKVGVNQVEPKASFQVEEYGIDTSSTTTTATTQVAIHTFPIADFRSARFTIQITNTTDTTYHSTEILAIHDGTTANITEFGEVHTGSSVEATFDADVSGGNFRLLATPTSTNNMTFKIVCHSLTV